MPKTDRGRGMRHVGAAMACALGALAGALAGGSIVMAQATPTATEPAPRAVDRAAAEADRLLAEAGSALDAARAWVRENVTSQNVDRLSAEAEHKATAWWTEALGRAHEQLHATLGTFKYHGGDAALPSAWSRLEPGAALPSHVVLLVHGLDEAGTIWNDLAPALAGAGYTPIKFNYRNDQAIAASADDLAAALEALRARGVERVSIVGHSMGGLVSRDVLTRDGLYGGDATGGGRFPSVDRLIMLGPPNQGAPLAPLRGVMEVRDQLTRWIVTEGNDPAVLLGFMLDGQGEAGTDLLPNSAFLQELNARPLPSGTAMTIVVGEIAPGTRERLAEAAASPLARRMLGDTHADALASIVRVASDTLGDGCVSTDGWKLDGVTDVVHVAADHRSMVRRIDALETARQWMGEAERSPPAIAVVLDRLGQTRGETTR